MLRSPQITAAAVAVIVFLGIMLPGITRYVLFGGTAILLVATFVWGDGFSHLAELAR